VFSQRSDGFTIGERSTGGFGVGIYVGPRASLDNLEKRNLLTLPGIEPRLLGLPARRVVAVLANICHLVFEIQL
jgi:hypothetical protein